MVGPFSVDRVSESVNDTSKKFRADGNIDDLAGTLDGVTLLEVSSWKASFSVLSAHTCVLRSSPSTGLGSASPVDKKILVETLRPLGETVGVTGDGTNDGPTLKTANVGFSMGITDTEVANPFQHWYQVNYELFSSYITFLLCVVVYCMSVSFVHHFVVFNCVGYHLPCKRSIRRTISP